MIYTKEDALEYKKAELEDLVNVGLQRYIGYRIVGGELEMLEEIYRAIYNITGEHPDLDVIPRLIFCRQMRTARSEWLEILRAAAADSGTTKEQIMGVNLRQSARTFYLDGVEYTWSGWPTFEG